jgi:hypothetical protein
MGRFSLPEDSSFATGQQNSRPLFLAKSPLFAAFTFLNEPDLVVVFPNTMAAGKSFLAQCRPAVFGLELVQ